MHMLLNLVTLAPNLTVERACDLLSSQTEARSIVIVLSPITRCFVNHLHHLFNQNHSVGGPPNTVPSHKLAVLSLDLLSWYLIRRQTDSRKLDVPS